MIAFPYFSVIGLVATTIIVTACDKSKEAAAEKAEKHKVEVSKIEKEKIQLQQIAEEEKIQKLKNKVIENFYDPQAAQFKNVRFNSGKDFICG